MTLRRISIPLVLAAVLGTAAFAQAGTAGSAGLVGEVGPGFSIEVTMNGRDLKKIKAGTYRIKVEDKASIHNFHLKGPGVNKSTSVAFEGDKVWRVTLKPGTYTYQCDPHAAAGMKGTFRVTR
jgi:plastocyanin